MFKDLLRNLECQKYLPRLGEWPSGNLVVQRPTFLRDQVLTVLVLVSWPPVTRQTKEYPDTSFSPHYGHRILEVQQKRIQDSFILITTVGFKRLCHTTNLDSDKYFPASVCLSISIYTSVKRHFLSANMGAVGMVGGKREMGFIFQQARQLI